MFDVSRLKGMRPGARLVNDGWGAVVVADDLLAAVDDGHIDAADLDVFEQESPHDVVDLRRLGVTASTSTGH
ncbi:NAD(P)-dependent oxidoreductase [Streptomyces sp. NPDC042319]|uniref:NAD(P)-dependent oxidoreductase n=1 Tax=Streptomyces sp. NPDC042319 TaxID=3154332 RepID=UPI00340B5DB3